MAKVKHTKNALKAERDALRRFNRFLPTLQLKKTQLQVESRRVAARLDELRSAEKAAHARVAPWVSLFSEEFDFSSWLSIKTVRTETANVAGVDIPLLKEIAFSQTHPDLLATPPWVDDGERTIRKLAELQIEAAIVETQLERLHDELRVTTQRVNLFEQVKIPEAKENIRVIRVFLGEEQTAAVARSKMAKAKTAAARAVS